MNRINPADNDRNLKYVWTENVYENNWNTYTHTVLRQTNEVFPCGIYCFVTYWGCKTINKSQVLIFFRLSKCFRACFIFSSDESYDFQDIYVHTMCEKLIYQYRRFRDEIDTFFNKSEKPEMAQLKFNEAQTKRIEKCHKCLFLIFSFTRVKSNWKVFITLHSTIACFYKTGWFSKFILSFVDVRASWSDW